MILDDYAQLVSLRKACRACTDLTNPSELDGGALDSDYIGPWSRWQGNLSANLMIVGQDWGDTRYFRQVRGLDEERKSDESDAHEVTREYRRQRSGGWRTSSGTLPRC